MLRDATINGVGDGTNPLLQFGGVGDSIAGVNATGGSYTYAITLRGSGQYISGNNIPAGTTDMYSLVGSSGWTIVQPDVPLSWTPVLNFGNASVGMTYATQQGTYWLNGKLINVCFNIALSAKGSSTGPATIEGFPFVGTATLRQSPLQTSYQVNLVSVTWPSPVVFLQGSSRSIHLATSIDRLVSLTDANFGDISNIAACGTVEVD
jgi:hypothetical protein